MTTDLFHHIIYTQIATKTQLQYDLYFLIVFFLNSNKENIINNMSISVMPKRKKSNLWLKRPKQRRFPRYLTPKKGVIISTPKKNVLFSTPTKAGRICKRLLTPESLPRASRKKKLHLYESPNNKVETVINENVVFDEFEETITEESKEYIDIATDKIVIEKLSEAGLLYYFFIVLPAC